MLRSYAKYPFRPMLTRLINIGVIATTCTINRGDSRRKRPYGVNLLQRHCRTTGSSHFRAIQCARLVPQSGRHPTSRLEGTGPKPGAIFLSSRIFFRTRSLQNWPRCSVVSVLKRRHAESVVGMYLLQARKCSFCYFLGLRQSTGGDVGLNLGIE